MQAQKQHESYLGEVRAVFLIFWSRPRELRVKLCGRGVVTHRGTYFYCGEGDVTPVAC